MADFLRLPRVLWGSRKAELAGVERARVVEVLVAHQAVRLAGPAELVVDPAEGRVVWLAP